MMVLPGRLTNWNIKTTENFKRWWAKVTVTDLRENVKFLLSSVDYKTKNKIADIDALPTKVHVANASKAASQENITAHRRLGKRPRDDGDCIDRAHEVQKARVHLQLFGQDDESVVRGDEFQRALSESVLDLAYGGHTREEEEVHTSMVRDIHPAARHLSSHERQECGKTSNAGAVPIPSSSSHATKMNDQVVEILLKALIDAPIEEAKNVAARVAFFFDAIRDSGGDVSILRTAVDGYMKSVARLLAIKQNVHNNAEQYSREINEVECELRSAQITYKGAVQTGKSLEKQERVIAKAKDDAEAKLRSLLDEMNNIKDQRKQQVETISNAKSSVDVLLQKLDDLKMSQAASVDLTHAERDLDQCKNAIKAAMH